MKTQLNQEGQITIHPEIRERLELKQGDEFLLIVTGNEIKLQPIQRKCLSEFRGVLPATQPYSGKTTIRQAVAQSLAQKSNQS
jgi:AbrB family looped-hinge helix DNA binding protein